MKQIGLIYRQVLKLGDAYMSIYSIFSLKFSVIKFFLKILFKRQEKLETADAFNGEGNGNPLQYSCLENPMDRGAWWATIHGVAKSRTRLSDFCVCVCVCVCVMYLMNF